jgi:hypothetical protein
LWTRPLIWNPLVRVRSTRGRCYDHNFLRLSPIFGETICVFLETNVTIQILPKLYNSILNKYFLAKIF